MCAGDCKAMEQPGNTTRNTVRGGDVYGTVFQAGVVDNVNTGAVHGGAVYLGGVHHHGNTDLDFRADGVRALDRKDYETAVADFTRARRAAPEDSELDFLLALALLRGNRPHRVRANREVTAVRDCLRRAGLLPHAQLLLLLAEEDRGRFWERGGHVSDLVLTLVDAMDPDQVRKILDHVTAPENRVWQLLAARQDRETGR